MAAMVLLPYSWALKELFEGDAVKEQQDGSMTLDSTLMQQRGKGMKGIVEVRRHASDASHGVVLHGLARMGVSQLFAPANGKLHFTESARVLADGAAGIRCDVSSLEACARALKQLQQAQQHDAYIDMYCSACHHGCTTGLRLAWQLSDLVSPALLPADGAGVATAWLPTLVLGGHYKLTRSPVAAGKFTVSTRN
jgi:hypothetical protein